MMKRIMFMTAADERGVCDRLRASIRHYNPDFLVFFTTEKARQDRLGPLFEKLGIDAGELEGNTEYVRGTVDDGRLSGTEYLVALDSELERVHDPEALHLGYRRVIRRVLDRQRAEGAVADNAVADITCGTRPMSAALFGAAYSMNVGIINHTDGEHDERGAVIAGTERCHATKGRKLRAFEKLEDAVDLFNRGEYVEAGRVAQRLEEVADVHLPRRGQGRRLVRTASSAFAAWDRFRFDEAIEHFQQLGDADYIDPGVVGQHLVNKNHRQRIQRHLYRARDEEMYVGILADLVANAGRRLDQHALDDALGRLYRALEYLAQLRLHAEFDLSTAEFPVHRLHGDMEVPVMAGATTCRIGLDSAWQFLMLERDELGLLYEGMLEDTDLRAALYQRNHSLLAHGFEPVDRKYVECVLYAVDRLAAEGWGAERWQSELDDVDFPSLRPFAV